MKIYEIPWLRKTHTLRFCLPVSEYRIRNLLGQRFSFAKVRARKRLCYAQVNIQENSSYVVIIKKHLICWVVSRSHSS